MNGTITRCGEGSRTASQRKEVPKNLYSLVSSHWKLAERNWNSSLHPLNVSYAAQKCVIIIIHNHHHISITSFPSFLQQLALPHRFNSAATPLPVSHRDGVSESVSPSVTHSFHFTLQHRLVRLGDMQPGDMSFCSEYSVKGSAAKSVHFADDEAKATKQQPTNHLVYLSSAWSTSSVIERRDTHTQCDRCMTWLGTRQRSLNRVQLKVEYILEENTWRGGEEEDEGVEDSSILSDIYNKIQLIRVDSQR